MTQLSQDLRTGRKNNEEVTLQQLSKDDFYNALWKRFQEYAIVLTNGTGGLVRQILQVSTIFIQEIKHINFQYKIFGEGYWGYGVNFIDDGSTIYSNTDIRIIKRLPELNKHLKYNIFNLMVFKIENQKFMYSILSVNICTGNAIKHINKELSLTNLTHIGVTQNDCYNTLKMFFSDGTFFSFQIDFGYKIWDYTPDYKNVLENIIKENKDFVEEQKNDLNEKLNLVLEKINGLIDGQQIIYEDIIEAIESKNQPGEKTLISKLKDKVTEILLKKGLDVIIVDAVKEIDKVF